MVDLLSTIDLDEVWLVGDEFGAIPSDYRKFHDVQEVKAAISQNTPEQRYILIKGSNSMRLFELPELL